jgi:uncharacterized RmlC-like cupin family protein
MNDITLIALPKILDERGNLSFLESDNHIPFQIKRTYLIYDVPGGEIRGGHAFKNQREVIVALSGSLDVILHDGTEEKRITLNRSYNALYIPAMMWRQMENFSTNAVVLCVASTDFDENDYIRFFDEYKNAVSNG